MRVVALTCSNTEIVCALGQSQALVAVDQHSDYPTEVVERLPRVGPDLAIDVQRVASQRPDLVLASLTVPGHERVVEQLERAKLPYIAPEPKRLSDVYENIRTIARALGVSERAETLIAEMQLELTPAQNRNGLQIGVEWWPKPIIWPGRESWVNDLLSAAGAKNPLCERPVKSAPLRDEDAAALAPDAAVMAWCGVRVEKYRREVVLRRPSWKNLELVRKNRVYAISEAWLGRPGPRLVEGARALRAVVADLQRTSERLED